MDMLQRILNFDGGCIMHEGHGIARSGSLFCSENCWEVFEENASDEEMEALNNKLDVLSDNTGKKV